MPEKRTQFRYYYYYYYRLSPYVRSPRKETRCHYWRWSQPNWSKWSQLSLPKEDWLAFGPFQRPIWWGHFLKDWIVQKTLMMFGSVIVWGMRNRRRREGKNTKERPLMLLGQIGIFGDILYISRNLFSSPPLQHTSYKSKLISSLHYRALPRWPE